jgi:nicotinate-nucleotide pyrophosphorylase (carboxylating)
VDHLKRIEVEVTNLSELEEALKAGVDVILLDNMSVEEVHRSVEITRGRAHLEVSGGISLDNVREYALTGADFISVGALTHSVKAADISMRLRL